jgi:hypothetical protein
LAPREPLPTIQKLQKFIGLTDVCQRPAPSFILQVPTGGSTSWPGPVLLASVSFVLRRQGSEMPGNAIFVVVNADRHRHRLSLADQHQNISATGVIHVNQIAPFNRLAMGSCDLG